MNSKNYLREVLFSMLIVMLSIGIVSCGNDNDEDGIAIGGVNVVGAWALVKDYNGKMESYYQYVVKSGGRVSMPNLWGEYVDGNLVVSYPEQYYDEKLAGAQEYQCSFKGNRVYYEDWEVAKFTVIDSETIEMVSAYNIGSGTLKKIHSIINKHDKPDNNDNPGSQTGEVNLGFIASNGLVYYFIGTFVSIYTDYISFGLSSLDRMCLFRIDDTGNITMDDIDGKYADGILKTTCSKDYRSEPVWKMSYKDENNHVYDASGRHIFDVQCIDGMTFYVQVPNGRSYELKKVTDVYWEYDFGNSGATTR